MAATGSVNKSSRRWCKSPGSLWFSFCRFYRRLLEQFFTRLGQSIASKPYQAILLTLFIVAACSVGFYQWQVERRTERLFVPQNSDSVRDLDKADQYFRLKVREETVLLEAPQRGNILTPNCLKDALKIHREIIKLDSYRDLCSTSSGEKADSDQSCLLLSPLEIFDFRNENLNNVSEKLDKAYKDPALLMRNGRPLIYNFPRLFGGVTKTISGQMIRAEAIQMIYFMRDTESRDILDWEKGFVKKMATMKENLTCGKIRYSTEGSAGEALSESIESGILYYLVGFVVAVTFGCAMLCKMGDPLTSHCSLAWAGVLAILLGNLAGFGLASFLGTPFIEMAGIVPFLVLGIGIDDMFITIRKLDEYRSHRLEDTIEGIMCHSGVFITMTTLIDVVALGVITTTQVPGIKYFCIYAACSVTLAYFMMVTFFVAFVVFDIRRQRSESSNCSPCCRTSRSGDGAPAWDEPQSSKRMLAAWGKFLVSPQTKVAVILLSVGFLGLGIYAIRGIDKGSDLKVLATHDSYFAEFVEAREEYFARPIEVSIVLSGRFDYGSKDRQMDITRLTDIVMKNPHYQNHTLSWFHMFTKFTEKKNLSIDSQKNFTSALKGFLEMLPFSLFKEDIRFSADQQYVTASRVLAFMKPTKNSAYKRDAMLSLRQDLAAASDLPVFPISKSFVFFEGYAVIPKELIRNALIAAVAILVVALPSMISISVVVLLCFGFVAFTMELLALMYIWDVPVDALSMMNLVMATGFYVEYNAHLAHAFITSPQRNVNDRVVNAMERMGPSLFKGGLCTLLGILVTGLSTLEIYRIFFRASFSTILLALFHGFCLLPVYLSIMCWKPAVATEVIPLNAYGEVNAESSEVVPIWERGIVIESDYEE